MGVRWRTAGGANTSLNAKKYGRRQLLELERAAVPWVCAGAGLVELSHDYISRSMIGGTDWSWQGQL